MLIRAIRAQNFMRFASVSLEELPLEGVIGVEGPNESGKTTLGEIVLFALFGKVRQTVDSPTQNLIRWGADSMSVEVELSIVECEHGTTGAIEDFLIFRQIDRHGTNYVKVVGLPERTEIASGNVQVAEFIARKLRFDVEEFQRSFYHDQYEIRRVQTEQVAFFESVTGIRHMQEAIDALRREVEPLEREFSYYQKEIARNKTQIEKHQRIVEKLGDLQALRDRLIEDLKGAEEQAAEARRRTEGLRCDREGAEARSKRLGNARSMTLDEFHGFVESLRDEENGARRARAAITGSNKIEAHSTSIVRCLENRAALAKGLVDLRRQLESELERIRSQRDEASSRIEDLDRRRVRERRAARRSFILAAAFLLLSVAAGTWLGHYWAEVAGGTRVSFAEAYPFVTSLPAEIVTRLPLVLGIACGVAAVVFLIHFVLFAKHSAVAKELRFAADGDRRATTAASELGDRIQASLEARAMADAEGLVRDVESCGLPAAEDAARGIREAHADLLADAKAADLEGALAASYQGLGSMLSNELGRLEKQLKELESSSRRLQTDLTRAESEIRECQAQAAKMEMLQEKNRELEESARTVRGDVDVHGEAAMLLEDTTAAIRAKVGPTLTRCVKAVLPALTAGRYRDMRVESDLEIKVYSSEKNDFLNLHELSGGTNEALTLALRLAVSQALVAARARQLQFVFLDEPFKMMDQERTLEALEILRSVSPDLRQFFVIQPEYLDAERGFFDCWVRTARDEDHLELRCP